jgi:hypothetical protein
MLGPCASLLDGSTRRLGQCRKFRVDMQGLQASRWREALSRTDAQQARRRACGEGRGNYCGPQGMPPVNAFICTVETPSLETALSQSLALGGTVAFPKMPVPGVGWLAYVKDPDGNVFGLLQPDQ